MNYADTSRSTQNKSFIIYYFNPDCDHCQYMTKQIILNKNSFTGTHLLMITATKEDATRKFINDYHLDSLSFVNVGIDTANQFNKIFGTTIVPSFFIYDNDHHLVKKISGETKINNLINCIQ